jgi:hypothetical protein
MNVSRYIVSSRAGGKVIHHAGVGVCDRNGHVRNCGIRRVRHSSDNGGFLRCYFKGEQSKQKAKKSEKSGVAALLTANQAPR